MRSPRDFRGHDINHLLRRIDGATFAVDTDLWLSALDLALQHGWRPMGTVDPDTSLETAAAREMRWAPATYFLPRGQTIQSRDGAALSRCLLEALETVPETELPLRDGPFGELNTLGCIELAMAGEENAGRTCGETARELVSGSPRTEALELAEFLSAGAVRVLPEGYTPPPAIED